MVGDRSGDKDKEGRGIQVLVWGQLVPPIWGLVRDLRQDALKMSVNHELYFGYINNTIE